MAVGSSRPQATVAGPSVEPTALVAFGSSAGVGANLAMALRMRSRWPALDYSNVLQQLIVDLREQLRVNVVGFEGVGILG
jgi:hypothetical protein